jgi:hypothetical protein
MSSFGKILAFFCLLGSLGIGAMCVLLYTSRVHYAAALKKEKIQRDLAEASESALKDELKAKSDKIDKLTLQLQRIANAKPTDDVAAQAAKLQAEIAVKDRQVQTLTASNNALEQALITANKKNAEYDAIVRAHQTGAAQNTADKEQLQKRLDAAAKENTELRLTANKAREEKTRFEIRATALEETNKQLLERSQDLVKENALLKKQLLAGTTTPTGVTTISLSAPNPPSFAVDGKVMDANDGLVEISIGSDAGLLKGHTLDVFRLGAKSQYLCMIRLITVEPHRSVGQIVGKPAMPVQRGDNVASKIVGN